MSALLLILALWLGLVATPVLINWSRYCYHNYDLGIYAQALQKISWGDLNPWLSVRQLRIFNDHFDPILIPLAPLAKWIEPSLAAILIELAFVVATGLVLWRRSAWAGAAFLFSTGVTAAVTFPAHPATWSVLPLAFLLIGLPEPGGNRSGTGVWLWAIALLCFKEEYVPVLLFLGVASLFVRALPRKTALQVIAISALWGIGVFWLRPKLLGPTSGYGSSFVAEWLQSPAAAFHSKVLDAGIWRGIRDLLLPFVPIWIWMWRSRIRPALPALLVFGALFGIRLLSGRWSHHYWIPLVICLVLLPGKAALESMPRRVAAWSLCLLLLVQVPYLGRHAGRTLFRGGLAHCPADPARLAELAEMRRLVESNQLPILATGQLVPRLLPSGEVLPIEHTQPERDGWLALDLNPHAPAWGIEQGTLDHYLKELRTAGASQVVLDGKWVRVEKLNPKPDEHPLRDVTDHEHDQAPEPRRLGTTGPVSDCLNDGTRATVISP